MKTALTFALLVLCLAGCGTSKKETADLGQARSVVQRFAAARDASACDLATAKMLRDVYGNFKAPLKKAKANCVKASSKFQGDQVKIIRSELLDPHTAKIVAHSSDEKFTYTVNLRRRNGGKPWRIDVISQAKL